MLTAKKKISVRQAVPQSSSADFFYNLQDWFKANTKIVGGVALGIAAIVIIGYLYTTGKAADELAANLELRKVQQLYQQQQYRLAITGDPAQKIMGLEEIVEKYGGTPTGDVAMLYLGNSYLYAGELDKAMSTFEDASPDTDMLRAAVIAGQAAVLEARGNSAEAAELFEKSALTFENELLSTERFLIAGRNYAEAGNMEKAKEMLDKVKESKNTKYQPDADRLLAQYNLTEE
ncbi:MAG: tetratricopeptide repeat protein [Bacteroidetes bacterium]|nr:tetratricopeptide repeat protein [Bacteroidota bacterium]